MLEPKFNIGDMIIRHDAAKPTPLKIVEIDFKRKEYVFRYRDSRGEKERATISIKDQDKWTLVTDLTIAVDLIRKEIWNENLK